MKLPYRASVFTIHTAEVRITKSCSSSQPNSVTPTVLEFHCLPRIEALPPEIYLHLTAKDLHKGKKSFMKIETICYEGKEIDLSALFAKKGSVRGL